MEIYKQHSYNKVPDYNDDFQKVQDIKNKMLSMKKEYDEAERMKARKRMTKDQILEDELYWYFIKRINTYDPKAYNDFVEFQHDESNLW